MSISFKREDGFTLLEVVFACAILAIAIMAYTVLKSSSRYSRIYSKQLSQSIQLSNNQLEDFMLHGYNSSLLSAGVGVTTTHPYTDLPANSPGNSAVGDFSFVDTTNWTVRKQCPSELSKLIQWNGLWSTRQLQLTQVQVRP